MIRTNSIASSSSTSQSSSSDYSSPPLSPRRFTFNALVARLSDSKKHLLDQIPHRQQQLMRFRKRARSFLSSSMENTIIPTNRSHSTSSEIISVDEIYRRYNSTHSNHDPSDEFGFLAPTLLQPSFLLNEEQSKQILLELPPRLHALNWYMIFSTETHGFSLNQLYRRTAEFDHDYPSLLVIKDVEQNVFGAFVPHQLIVSESVYGTGESFLFTFYPEFRAFNWSGSNEFYVKGDLHSLGFGIGDGRHGLWIDGDLYHGRTCTSRTFNNDRLTCNEDFIIASVELWTFVD